MRKILCHCEQEFTANLPTRVDLDVNPELIQSIKDGTFLLCVCPACNARLKLDLETEILWPSKKSTLLLIPELERLPFLAGNKKVHKDHEIVIGYPELADRVTVLSCGLEPLAIEAIKHHICVKAKAENPDHKPVLFFETKNDNTLIFHMHGIKDGEIALVRIPLTLYTTIVSQSREQPEDELFQLLRNKNYLSYQNILIDGE